MLNLWLSKCRFESIIAQLPIAERITKMSNEKI